MEEWYDPIVAIATLISAVVSMIVAFFIYVQQSTLRTQTENLKTQTIEMKKEISNRMRPWIKLNFELSHILTVNGESRDEMEYFANTAKYGELKEARFLCIVENIGSMPATKLYVKFLDSTHPITKETVWKDGESDLNPIPIMPHEKINYPYAMSQTEYYNSEKNPIYFGIHIGYFIDEQTSTTIGKIWKVSSTKMTSEDYWFDEPK